MFAGAFAMIFGIYYLKTRQNLAMIEKGMNPKEFADCPAPYKNLKWAMLLIGAGVGLFLAYLLDNYVLLSNQTIDRYNDERNVPIYFALIAIGGGLGRSPLTRSKRNGTTTTKSLFNGVNNKCLIYLVASRLK